LFFGLPRSTRRSIKDVVSPVCILSITSYSLGITMPRWCIFDPSLQHIDIDLSLRASNRLGLALLCEGQLKTLFHLFAYLVTQCEMVHI